MSNSNWVLLLSFSFLAVGVKKARCKLLMINTEFKLSCSLVLSTAQALPRVSVALRDACRRNLLHFLLQQPLRTPVHPSAAHVDWTSKGNFVGVPLRLRSSRAVPGNTIQSQSLPFLETGAGEKSAKSTMGYFNIHHLLFKSFLSSLNWTNLSYF